MQQKTRWTKLFTLVALAAGLAACSDSSPTALEPQSSGGATASPAMRASVSSYVAYVLVYPSSATIDAGAYRQFSALAVSATGQLITTPPPVTWTSSNTAVATVSSKGAVKGVGSGTATITANMGGVIGRATVKVLGSASVASVKLTPTSSSLAVGKSEMLTAVPMDASGTPLSGYTVSWSSSNSAVAKVYSNGTVTAVAPGTVTITATAGGKSARATVSVTSTSTATTSSTFLVIYPTSVTLAPGGYRQATALAFTSSGTLVTTLGTPTWTSSNPAVATVSSTGVIKAISPGSATIKATVGGLSDTSPVYVTAPLQ